MTFKIKKILPFLPALLWMALIFYASSRQRVAFSGDFLISFLFFKTLHLIEYGLLFFFWKMALYNNRYSTLFAILISVFYGVLDEIHQTLVPTREGRVRDIFIDSLGVLIFWLFLFERVKKFVFKIGFLKKLYSI